MESLAQQGTVGHAQMGGSGMEMHGSHAQHPMDMGMGGVKHMPPSVSNVLHVMNEWEHWVCVVKGTVHVHDTNLTLSACLH